MKPEQSKKKKVSIKWTFFGYFMVLVLVMLVVIWTLRLVFVESTYKQVRISIAEKTVEEAQGVFDKGGDIVKLGKNINTNTDTTFILLDGDGNTLFTSVGEYKAHVPTKAELYKISDNTKSDKHGIYIDNRELEDSEGVKNNYLIYAHTVSLPPRMDNVPPYSTDKGTIVLTCGTKMMDSTMKTMNVELLLVTLFMVLIAFLTALLLAKHISKPIEAINNKSSRLAKGDYSVRFSDEGYKEIAELGETLNYTAVELGKTDRMRRDLIANVSHDLRTPLTMIRGYIEMMRDMPNENNEENMNVIIKETDYLTHLVKDMLDISKLDSNVVVFKAEEFDMIELLQGVADRYNAMYKQQGYVFEYTPVDAKVIVKSDKVMITNVVYNLINNAVNHIGDDKKVTITSEIIDDRLHVHVIDRGEGIEESKLDTIWDRYYKAERNLKRESAGSGLGLSIVKTVLTKLNCNYGVKSKVDEGSDFYFDIAIVKIDRQVTDDVETSKDEQ